jgi:hypothetical protein
VLGRPVGRRAYAEGLFVRGTDADGDGRPGVTQAVLADGPLARQGRPASRVLAAGEEL